MGEVYRARDSRLDRDVAVKVLPRHLANDPQALARFEREGKAIAALSHPNILAVYDVGTDQGVSYVVTELLEGETLRSRVARAAVGWAKAAEIGAAVADGLATAHAKGIIHRDLKPENIFLTSDGRVKILDFGLASRRDNASPDQTEATQTEPGMVMGTAGYMSPEQVRGEPAGAPSDLFSLGAVLYEMATAVRPFARQTAAETMVAILNADPPRAAGAGREIPPELDRLIARCLEKNPEARQQSAGDLAFALREVTGSGARSGALQALPGGRGRRTYAIGMAVAGALALAVGLTLYLLLGSGGKAIDTLAVMPFDNASHDPNMEYLSDGITDSITNKLSQLGGLRVTARCMVFAYKGKPDNPQQVGRDLKVRAVLNGSVVQRGGLLIIRAELVNVADGSQMWGDQYQRKLDDILAIEAEISQEISQRLRLKLTGEDRARLARRATENTEAYQLYLQGRFYWNQNTEAGMRKAVECYQQAIDKDPAYARAYAGLADAYNSLGFMAYMPSKEAFPNARAAANRALRLDDTLSEAHNSLAGVRYLYDWDWPGAEKELKRAIELDPDYATAHDFYSHFLIMTGRTDEAMTEIRRALALDPVSVRVNSRLGVQLYFARQFDQAIKQLRKTLELDPNHPMTSAYLGMAYLAKSMYPEAIEAMRKLPGPPTRLALAYAMAGRRAEAKRIVDRLEEIAKTSFVSPADVAYVYAALGQKDAAMGWMEKAYEARSPPMVFLKMDPKVDSLRADPRFRDLLRRVGLPQ